ncbi:MOSC domain-containing protein [Glaciecola sp. KUL10]|uniref:MOSC domain-containing protein n=1 Tax=Glaciecola sp. (strain KUL10) TaxID=2161813 RepID=UPI000D78B732|nr:MOSC domain-containing protein [Glaciecola sp. KUL10]GBL04592.1 MOSC domain-containing protein [Glaciecola sp. KUL10]
MYIEALYAGKPTPFGPRKTPSSIIKQPFQTIHVEFDGAVEDEQGNKKLHGGPEMAIHQYSQFSYQVLKNHFESIADRFVIGSIGENISSPDMTDENVLIGDIYKMGDVLLQVSSPRAPCVKINQRYFHKDIDLFIAKQGITGWYYRVMREGKITIGDPITLEDRDEQNPSIKEVMRLVRTKMGLREQKQEASNASGLAQEWVKKLMR